MDTIIGFAINPIILKDLFGEYRLVKPVQSNKFYSVIGEVTDKGMVARYTNPLPDKDKIYWRSIKVKGIGTLRAISIALSFESYEEFVENPYSCVLNYALDFDVIDKVAKSLGFPDDSLQRLTAMAVHKLVETGNTLWSKSEIEKEVGKSLDDDTLRQMTFIKVGGYFVLEKLKEAVDIILSKKDRIHCITGMAGTGKTTTLVEMYKEQEGYIVAFTAKAAQRVNEVLGDEVATTIHRLIYSKPSSCNVVYIDEASMVNTMLLAGLMDAVDANRYVMIGDSNQLSAIGGGSPFMDFCKFGGVEVTLLNHIYRTDSEGIITNASNVLSQQELVSGYNDFKIGDTFRLPKVIEQNKDAMYLTFTNSQRNRINNMLRKAVNPNPTTSYKYCSYALGDKVMHLKNNYNYGIFNSDIGKVVYLDKYCIGVKYPKCPDVIYYMDSKLSVNIHSEPYGRRFADCGAGTIYKQGWKVTMSTYEKVEPNMYTVCLAYCLTVHKAQGSEADNVVVCTDGSPYISNQWLYTAITRAKKSCKLLASKSTIADAIANLDVRNTYLRYILEEGV